MHAFPHVSEADLAATPSAVLALLCAQADTIARLTCGPLPEGVPTGQAGPRPRVVPDLTGLTIEAATAALDPEGLVLIQFAPEFSNSVEAGLIVRQDLPAGTSVDRGAVISVAISQGPDLVAVPPLGNLTLQQATDTLTAGGLAVGTVIGNVDGVLVAAKYQGVDVLPGQMLLRGSAIDIAFF